MRKTIEDILVLYACLYQAESISRYIVSGHCMKHKIGINAMIESLKAISLLTSGFLFDRIYDQIGESYENCYSHAKWSIDFSREIGDIDIKDTIKTAWAIIVDKQEYIRSKISSLLSSEQRREIIDIQLDYNGVCDECKSFCQQFLN